MSALLCLAAVAGVRADDFAALRAEAAGRTVRLAPGTQLEALVVSDYRSQNMELNPNVSWDKVDLGENLRTAYVESPDGRYGFRLRFAGIYENRLERGDRVRLDLGGCSLTGETDPERYTVDGLCTANVEVLERGVALPAKERRIADLKDEDLYTYVTLAGTEFLSKQGCYANVFESCVQRSRLNAFDQPSRRTDGWASLLKDADNGSIYMLVNTKCAWRRDGRGVPHGVGAVSGVLVHTPMRRYGGDMGRYAIRPLDERDGAGYVVVGNAIDALQRLAADWRRRFGGTVVGITAITTAPSASRSRATRPAPRSRASRATVSFPTRARGFSRRPPGPGCGSIRSTTRAMRRTATARPCASTPPCGSIPTPATGSGSTTAAA